ncbi:MAG: hypothetical protein HGA67_00615 [Candidatus Yonathbacteria bacterium]|nr:hypothetical protein [Candidatus Yonathbacteria bacterium]
MHTIIEHPHDRHPDSALGQRLIHDALEYVERTNRPYNLHIGPLVLDIHPGDREDFLVNRWELLSHAMYIPEKDETPEHVAEVIKHRAHTINFSVTAEIPGKVKMFANPGGEITIVSVDPSCSLSSLGLSGTVVEKFCYF